MSYYSPKSATAVVGIDNGPSLGASIFCWCFVLLVAFTVIVVVANYNGSAQMPDVDGPAMKIIGGIVGLFLFFALVCGWGNFNSGVTSGVAVATNVSPEITVSPEINVAPVIAPNFAPVNNVTVMVNLTLPDGRTLQDVLAGLSVNSAKLIEETR